MSKKIYVGNLSYSTTPEALEGIFGQYGTILSVNIITDKFSGQSKGFGFVEMEDEKAATAAISSLNNTNFNGRDLKVNEALDRQPRRDNYR